MARYKTNNKVVVYNPGSITSPPEVIMHMFEIKGESGIAYQMTIDTPGDSINSVGTVFIEASIDGTNWTSLGGDWSFDIADGAIETNIWNITNPQYDYIRARMTTSDISSSDVTLTLTSWTGV